MQVDAGLEELKQKRYPLDYVRELKEGERGCTPQCISNPSRTMRQSNVPQPTQGDIRAVQDQ
eukprot:scaffold152965_cov22-Tisochrysis_lutea.AAC.1